MGGEFLFNNRDSNVFFWINHMRRWDIRDLINFQSNRRRSHSKSFRAAGEGVTPRRLFFNSNWLCWILCFFFILNNFIRESRGWEFWVKNSFGAGFDIQSSIMILIVLSKGSVQFCPEILWVFNRFSEVAQARRKVQTYCSKSCITTIYPVILILIRLFTNSNRHLIDILSLYRCNHLQLPLWISYGWSKTRNW